MESAIWDQQFYIKKAIIVRQKELIKKYLITNNTTISANHLEGSFGPQKSQIAFGAEIPQFLRKRESRSACEV